MDKFQIHDITSETSDLEQLGTKKNFWFPFSSGSRERCLFKYSIEVFSSVAEQRQEAKAYWLAALEKMSLDEMNAIFGKIPEGVISECAQAFAIAMILENKKRLLNYGNE